MGLGAPVRYAASQSSSIWLAMVRKTSAPARMMGMVLAISRLPRLPGPSRTMPRASACASMPGSMATGMPVMRACGFSPSARMKVVRFCGSVGHRRELRADEIPQVAHLDGFGLQGGRQWVQVAHNTLDAARAPRGGQRGNGRVDAGGRHAARRTGTTGVAGRAGDGAGRAIPEPGAAGWRRAGRWWWTTRWCSRAAAAAGRGRDEARAAAGRWAAGSAGGWRWTDQVVVAAGCCRRCQLLWQGRDPCCC